MPKSNQPNQPELLCRRCGVVTNSYLCPRCDPGKGTVRRPKPDPPLQRPEEEPGWGWGI